MSTTLRSAKEDALNEEEARQLLRACRDPLDHMTIRLPLFCGLRIGEVQHMTRAWVVWDKGIIQIPNRQLCSCYECKKWRRGIWTPKTAAGVRSLLITDEVKPNLAEFFSSNEAVNRSRQALEQRVERIHLRSGLLCPVYPYCLRASFATRLAELGMSAPSLSYILGWQDLESAEHYVQSSRRRAHEENAFQLRILEGLSDTPPLPEG